MFLNQHIVSDKKLLIRMLWRLFMTKKNIMKWLNQEMCLWGRSADVLKQNLAHFLCLFKMPGRGHINSIFVVPDLTNGEKSVTTVVMEKRRLFISSEAVLIV